MNENTLVQLSDKNVYCTLLNSFYLDKVIVMIKSLQKFRNVTLFVFAFDEKTEEILNSYNFDFVKVISSTMIEDEMLKKIKGERSTAEYTWTCKNVIVEYVLNNYAPKSCTYIDADMYFYLSPSVLIEEFEKSGCSVGISKHFFPDTRHGRELTETSGKYCAVFNTFKNDEKGRGLLEKWKKQCYEKCSVLTCGDQLYISDWGEKYSEVYEYQNIGGGVAPWNLINYKLRGEYPEFEIVGKNKTDSMVYYHFQGVAFLTEDKVRMNVISYVDNGFISKKIVEKIYNPYLIEIKEVRNELKTKFGYDMSLNTSAGIKKEKQRLSAVIKRKLDKIVGKSVSENINTVARVLRNSQDIVEINNLKM